MVKIVESSTINCEYDRTTSASLTTYMSFFNHTLIKTLDRIKDDDKVSFVQNPTILIDKLILLGAFFKFGCNDFQVI